MTNRNRCTIQVGGRLSRVASDRSDEGDRGDRADAAGAVSVGGGRLGPRRPDPRNGLVDEHSWVPQRGAATGVGLLPVFAEKLSFLCLELLLGDNPQITQLCKLLQPHRRRLRLGRGSVSAGGVA